MKRGLWWSWDPQTDEMWPVNPGESIWGEERRIGRDTVRTPFGDIEVSTVFLGLDHGWNDNEPPVLFETMTFGGPFDQEQERYCAAQAAREGHIRAVKVARQTRYRLDWWLRHWWRKVRS